MDDLAWLLLSTPFPCFHLLPTQVIEDRERYSPNYMKEQNRYCTKGNSIPSKSVSQPSHWWHIWWMLFPPSGKNAALSQSITPATESKFGCSTIFERSQSICDKTGLLKGLIWWINGTSSFLYAPRKASVDSKGPRWGSWGWMISPEKLCDRTPLEELGTVASSLI